MITMDYKDAGAFAAIFFAIAVLFGLIPVLWVGDLAIYAVNYKHPDAPRIVYITAWLGATSFYYFFVLEQLVAQTLLKGLGRDAQIVVYYLQGLFFGTLMYYSNIKPAVSSLPIHLIVKIFGGYP